MKIHEYQAKELLGSYGVPVPKGGVAKTPDEARQKAEQLGGAKPVVKAQVHAGGRGKAGGVKVVGTPAEAAEFAKKLLGTKLVTHQTGPGGVPVNSVLVEEAIDVARELYLSILVDGARGRIVIIASQAGGMDIEEVAAKTPEQIVQVALDPLVGYQPFHGRLLSQKLGLDATQSRAFVPMLGNLVRAFIERDCSMIEINPLVVTKDNRVLAADAKVNFDDNAAFRQKANPALRDPDQEDPLERLAADKGVQYVKLDGNVGCMVNGAGLAMATMDLTKMAGLSPANFLDVGGGASQEQVTEAFKLIVSDKDVKKVLVNVFGGILRCDIAANGIVEGVKATGTKTPIVVRMTGTNWEEGQKILRDSKIKCAIVNDLSQVVEALQKA